MSMPSMTDVHQDAPLGGRRKKNKLTDLAVDFVSLVKAGDNPSARVVLLKAKPAKDAKADDGDGVGDDPDDDNNGGKMDDKDVLKDAPSAVVAYVEQLEEAVIKAETERDEALAKAKAPAPTDGDGADDLLEKALKNTDPAVAAILKSQQEAIAKANERAENAEKVAKAEQEARTMLLLKSRVSSQMNYLGDADALTTILAKSAAALDAATYQALEGVLVEANRGLATGAVFTEIGKTGTAGNADPLTKLATEIQKADPKLTWDQAIDQAMTRDPQAYRMAIAGGAA